MTTEPYHSKVLIGWCFQTRTRKLLTRLLSHRINMEHLGVSQFYQRSFPRGRGGGGVGILFKHDAFFFFLRPIFYLFKDFVEFVTILLLFHALVFWPLRQVRSQLPNQGSNPYPLHWKAKS